MKKARQVNAEPSEFLEARTRIELVYTDLQSAASPLRHRASCGYPLGRAAYNKAIGMHQRFFHSSRYAGI